MSAPQIIVARAPGGSAHEFKTGSWDGAELRFNAVAQTSVRSQIEAAMAMGKVGRSDLTISTRTIDEVVPPLESATELADYALGTSIAILCAEGRDAEYFVHVWRAPDGKIVSPGRSSRVATKVVMERFSQLLSDAGGADSLRVPARVPREFMIRRQWFAAEILPSSFPAPKAVGAPPGTSEKWKMKREMERHRPRNRE